jgi:hypothetical protein
VRLVRIAAIVLGVAVVGLAIAWLLRSDPIGPIAGRAVSGSEAPYPSDWSFSDQHDTIAVEVRPEDPHSVTTIAFVHDGHLHVPAMNGSEKQWTQMVRRDARVRLKVGDAVYAAKLVRVEAEDREPYFDSAASKYAQMAEAREQGETPEDIWLFRVEAR